MTVQILSWDIHLGILAIPVVIILVWLVVRESRRRSRK